MLEKYFMKFPQRLAYYLFGLMIGAFFVAFILGGKDTSCNYFPNSRVLSDLRTKPFHYSDAASQVLAEGWIDTVDVKNTLKHGDVDFDQSNIKYKNGKIYIIEGKTVKNQEIILKVVNYEKKAVLESITKIN